ncbi:MAG: hypothetical protein RJA57_1163 [Bacteroidota bacterium]|jgi:tRNA threonylcarbamoyladenosine biosynthesis protein TsaB
MSLILHIDTALGEAGVCLGREGRIVAMATQSVQKDHAAWLQVAVEGLLGSVGHSLHDLRGIAISIGPGSYTGLRVGLSSAKGYCFALSIPLIAIDTLKIIAHSVRHLTVGPICPMIDARRMEVYTAVYDQQLHPLVHPHALILTEEGVNNLAHPGKVSFCGNGAGKLRSLSNGEIHPILPEQPLLPSLTELSWSHYQRGDYSSLAYTEPAYLKEFHGGKPTS